MTRLAFMAVLAGGLCVGCADDGASPDTTGGPGANGDAAPSVDRTAGSAGETPSTNQSAGGTSHDEGSGPILRAPEGVPAGAAPDGDAPAGDAPAGDAPAGNGTTSATAAPAGSTAEARILNWDQTLDLVQQQQGKVVVLDLWSHSCLPCLRELPHFAELCRKHPEQVVGISFNMDYTGLKKEPPESFRDGVTETLGKLDAAVISVVSGVPDIELIDQIELGSVPAVYVFDQSGKQVQRFDNDNAESEFTYEKDIVPLVESLLAQSASE